MKLIAIFIALIISGASYSQDQSYNNERITLYEIREAPPSDSQISDFLTRFIERSIEIVKDLIAFLVSLLGGNILPHHQLIPKQ